MLNPDSVAAVAAARFGERFVRPIYDGYGFACIPGTVERLLTGGGGPALPEAALGGLGQRHERVVLLLIDAFGWRFFAPRAEADPFLRRFLGDGVVSRLTTMFPSTTSAHVTALHTGRPPAASGVFEWFFYEPSLGRVIAPLLFSFAGDRGRETLADAGVDPAFLVAGDTLYQRLAARGVRSSVYQHASYAHSTYTGAVCAGAELVPYRTLAEAITLLGARLAAEPGPAYHFLYVDTVDTICHLYGPESPHVAAELDAVLTTCERLLVPALAGAGRPALLLLAADHGQIAIDPARAHMLNRTIPGLEAATPRGADGRPLAPSGSSRDLFLYLEQGREAAFAQTIALALAGRAEVHRTAELVAAGMFGPAPSAAFLSRLGGLAVLPYAGETVWWDDQRFQVRFRGSHGGLTPEEAHTQLAALGFG
ncbi:MAG TPA: alkaline phosphatase family protein [Chloroflexaceae bacterium]|nr:alkaline phosphatase family protein [Chloroflexaceae bacterium]